MVNLDFGGAKAEGLAPRRRLGVAEADGLGLGLPVVAEEREQLPRRMQAVAAAAAAKSEGGKQLPRRPVTAPVVPQATLLRRAWPCVV